MTLRQRHALTPVFQITGTVSNGTGSTNDACLRWTNIVTTDATTGFYTVTQSATLGDSVALNVPGMYEAQFALDHVASTSLIMGIAVGGSSAFDANPVVGTNGCIASIPLCTNPAGSVQGRQLSVMFNIDDADRDGTANVVRFLATDGSNATPASSLTQSLSWFRIVQICDKP